MHKIIGIVVGATLLGMLFVGSFLGALHQPEPHGVPVAVVGPSQLVEQMRVGISQKKPGAFALSEYTSVEAGRQALLDREVDAVLVPQESKLIVASAGGRTAATVITAAFQGAAQGKLTVEDAVPLPPGDAGGISGMFYTLSLVLPGIAMAVLLSQLALGLVARVSVLVAGSLVVGAANSWLADVVFGALPGTYGGLVLISSAIVLVIGLVGAGFVKIMGTPGVGLAALLFIAIGLPASGGPLGARFIPEWYAAIGQFLPVGSGADAVRNIVSFDGAALGWPLGVLAAWAVVGVVLLALPGRRGAPAADRDRVPVAA